MAYYYLRDSVRGDFNVSMHWPNGTGAATNVPVSISRSGGTTNLTVNQRQVPGADGWYNLGPYTFLAGSGYVQIKNTGTSGYVFADAVKFQRLTTSADFSVVLQGTPEKYAYDVEGTQPGYDADGNLTGDGLWNYTWDGENRLISMQSKTSVPTAKRKKITFAYDYMGRRVMKSVHGWNTSQNNYGPESYGRTYVYDGGNVVAELQCHWAVKTSHVGANQNQPN